MLRCGKNEEQTTFQVLIGVVWLGSTITIHGAAIKGEVHCTGMEDNGNAVVFIARCLDQPEMEFEPPVDDVIIDQYNLTFVPHVLPVLQGTRVAFPNSDEVRHNVFSPSHTKRFNLGTYPQGTIRYVLFDGPGVVALLCNVHQEMSAYVIVTQTPFFAVTDGEGRFEIKDVPAGRYILKTWHERLPSISREINVVGPSLAVEIELRD